MAEIESGKFAYECYCASCFYTEDKPLPTWEQLDERRKNGWIACYESISMREKKISYLKHMFSVFMAQKELSEKEGFQNSLGVIPQETGLCLNPDK